MKNRSITFTAILLAIGFLALAPNAQAVVPPPDGGYPGLNTAEGQNALFSVTTGAANTAVGWFSLLSNTDGAFNTGVGAGTLLFNIGDQTTGEGTENTAIGAAALLFNTTGGQNTAVGTAALLNNTTGLANTAIGDAALRQNTDGFANTANGFDALFANTSGEENTALGFTALFSNTAGAGNMANGFRALFSNITGDFNTANGVSTLGNNTTGSNNVALGAFAGSVQTTGSNNVYIGPGTLGVAGESDACYIGSIFGQTSASGIPVLINSSNKLGTTTSSTRFKEDIKPMDKASVTLFSLKPVTFRYKHEIDPSGRSQFGLVAEDVAKVNPDLVVRDKEGKPYTVRYEEVNAMLLNEFLKEHKKVEEQQATIAELKKAIARLATRDEEQAAQIQKVSAQIEVSKFATGRIRRGGPAPQVARNDY
jgi:hypothetical protein